MPLKSSSHLLKKNLLLSNPQTLHLTTPFSEHPYIGASKTIKLSNMKNSPFNNLPNNTMPFFVSGEYTLKKTKIITSSNSSPLMTSISYLNS